MNTILVVGGTGFIGKRLVNFLIKKMKSVVCLIRKREDMPKFPKTRLIRFTIGDLLDRKTLESAVKNVDHVVHVGGITHAKNSREFFEVNVVGTKNLLRACKRANVKRFIYVSSANVLNPWTDPYAESKKLAERETLMSGLPYIILRPSMVYGKGDTKNIGWLAERLKRSCFLPIVGDGRFLLQPVHVDDVIIAIEKCLSSEKNNRVYTIAGPPITFNDLVSTLCRAMKLKCTRIHLPLTLAKVLVKMFNALRILPNISERIARSIERNVDQTYDITSTKRDLGLEFTPFEVGIMKMLK